MVIIFNIEINRGHIPINCNIPGSSISFAQKTEIISDNYSALNTSEL